jgi:hypothetical protein
MPELLPLGLAAHTQHPMTHLLSNSLTESHFPGITIATHWLSVYSDMGRQYSKEKTK